jgi:hypothetical protein
MSSSGSHAILVTESVDSELYRPMNSNNPDWKYRRLLNKDDPNTIKCLLCNQISKGGITRLKMHLAGIRGNIRKCSKADVEVQREITDYLEVVKKKQEERKRAKEEIVADVDIHGDGSEFKELET